ncbi:hypothetical protein AFV9_gp59 [Betalipothrixvirus uzonense]|uniref:Uncharacterized protein n=1 Tax=Betalipothrixvirus uzonense TaxID=512792 RepID=B2CRN6_9VIRU|nr:hypothetical protein AFV9_gp59 [Acidianus filamentous virus 9]ACB37293.1 hypothetical protein [Acidianus filamentous virus 9]
MSIQTDILYSFFTIAYSFLYPYFFYSIAKNRICDFSEAGIITVLSAYILAFFMIYIIFILPSLSFTFAVIDTILLGVIFLYVNIKYTT